MGQEAGLALFLKAHQWCRSQSRESLVLETAAQHRGSLLSSSRRAAGKPAWEALVMFFTAGRGRVPSVALVGISGTPTDPSLPS